MRPPKRLWLVRHGPTHAKTMVGWSDLPADLSDTAQIARLDAALPPAAPVISSDLIRAVDTASAIAGTRDRLPHDPSLREIHFGAWEDRSFDSIQAEAPEHIFAFWDQPGDIRAPNGESWNDLSTRVSRAIDALLALDHQDIVVVAHFGVILTQLGRALGQTPLQTFAQKIDNLSVTQLSFDGNWDTGVINHLP